jgi:hypothetical protein
VVCVVGAEPDCLFSENKMILLLKMGEGWEGKVTKNRICACSGVGRILCRIERAWSVL